jgi:hypothetical protein
MSYLSKLKNTKSLTKQVKDAQSEQYEKDHRVLNYYDLKEGEKMKLIFVPDENGELWAKFAKHGANLTYTSGGKTRNVPGVGSIGTIANNSESPIMQHGYSFLEKERQTGDKKWRDEAKKWFPRDYTIMSCVVLESPIEVKPNNDGNEVKLINVPQKVVSKIMNELSEGNISEEEFFITPFILKASRNDSGFRSYEESFFARKPMSDGELEDLDERTINLFDYSTLDMIPKTPTIDEQQAWLDKAIAAYNRSTGAVAHSDDEEEEAPRKVQPKVRHEEEDDEPPRRSAPARRVVEEDDEEEVPRKKSRVVEDDEDDEPPRKATRRVEEDEDADSIDHMNEPKPEARGSIRDRLSGLRRK